MKIAVIGAGFLGTCTSLELSRRGYDVDLFDENAEPITQAGRVNEGKIHLGLVYANDPSLQTAEMMLKGAFHFGSLLEKWIGTPLDETWLSSPFYYGIHKDSLLGIEEIRAHFDAVQNHYRELIDKTGLSYLNIRSDDVFQEIKGNQAEHGFDQQTVPYLFKTLEKSVNIRKVAERLRECIRQSNSINFHSNTRVESVKRLLGSRLKLTFCKGNNGESDSYDHVVNAAWFGRLAIDQTLDLIPQRPWLYRFKNGIFVNAGTGKSTDIIPSVTLMLGSFGDLVNFQDCNYYASWYPAGMVATSKEIKPEGWPFSFNAQEQEKIKTETLRELSMMCPNAGQLLDSDYEWEMRGNAIFAWGKQDIDELSSELHNRYDIGVLSDGNYHSVDPGKYTMVPYFANHVVDQIEGRPEEGFC
jgi:hypothetical protein